MAELEYELTEDGKKIKQKLPLTGVRKVIANNLKSTWENTVPISGFFKYDCSGIKAYKKKLEEAGVKVSYTEIFIMLTKEAIKAAPVVNAAILEKRIEIYESINMGVALAAPDGSLLVPVLKELQDMDIKQITEAFADIKKRGREGKLTFADMQSGTITISSMGMFDTYGFTQVPAAGQVAILGFGSIRDEAVVLEDGTIGVRPMMYVSITADHRVVQGAAGASFMAALGNGFKDPESVIKI